jgi:hypothetical protein
MSTRGFVGMGIPDQFHARYNHYDSYPSGLGPKVWTTVRQFLSDDGDLHGFARTLLGYTDWRQMETGGLCEYCGQRTGQPHSISGLISVPDSDAASLAEYQETLEQDALQRHAAIERAALRPLLAKQAWKQAIAEWRIIENRRRTGYPDPDAQHHQHDSGDPENSAITPENIDWLFMEWGYLIDPDAHTLHVMVGCIETPVTYTIDIIRPNGDHEAWTHKTRYTGALLGSYDLRKPEPQWSNVEAAGDALRDSLRDAFAADRQHPLLDGVRARPCVEVWDQRATVSSS